MPVAVFVKVEGSSDNEGDQAVACGGGWRLEGMPADVWVQVEDRSNNEGDQAVVVRVGGGGSACLPPCP